MKKIIHLSDLHIGYDNMSDILDDMIDRLIYLYQPASEYVVVVTGDMVDDATKTEQLETAQRQMDRIKNAGFSLLATPGNHDYGTGNNATPSGMRTYKEYIYGDPNERFPRFDPIDDIAFIGLDSMEGEIKKKQGLLADGEIGDAQLEALERLLKSQPVKNCESTPAGFSRRFFMV